MFHLTLACILVSYTKGEFLTEQYIELQKGEILQGTQSESLQAVDSVQECSVRCTTNHGYIGYSYIKKQRSCTVILKNDALNIHETFTATADNRVFKKDNCLKNECVNAATCIDDFDNYTCSCVPGFLGTYCNDINECYMNIACMNNGTCVDGNNTFSCLCAYGWTGPTCEAIDLCTSNPCENGGSCVSEVGSYTCDCDTGWTGIICDEPDDCVSNPCQNSGTCVDGDGLYNCSCGPGWIGNYCEDLDGCFSNPCENNGTCITGTLSYTCNCSENYAGENCETNCNEEYCTPSGWNSTAFVDNYFTFQTAPTQISSGSDSISDGKIGKALDTSLGYSVINIEGACIINPKTCGATGGAVAFWVYMYADSTFDYGPMTSIIYVNNYYTEGFGINKWGRQLLVHYDEAANNRYHFSGAPTLSTGIWYHFVFSFSHPGGINSFLNGEVHATVPTPSGFAVTPKTDTRLVVGGDHIFRSGKFLFDDLLFFNGTLSLWDAKVMYDQHK